MYHMTNSFIKFYSVVDHGFDFGVNTFVTLVDQSTVDPSIVDRTSHTLRNMFNFTV